MSSPSNLSTLSPSPAVRLRRWAYRLSAVLAVVYVVYVLALKLANRVIGGPLGEVGEFLLVLACVTMFAVGLFADEATRRSPTHSPPTH